MLLAAIIEPWHCVTCSDAFQLASWPSLHPDRRFEASRFYLLASLPNFGMMYPATVRWDANTLFCTKLHPKTRHAAPSSAIDAAQYPWRALWCSPCNVESRRFDHVRFCNGYDKDQGPYSSGILVCRGSNSRNRSLRRGPTLSAVMISTSVKYIPS